VSTKVVTRGFVRRAAMESSDGFKTDISKLAGRICMVSEYISLLSWSTSKTVALFAEIGNGKIIQIYLPFC